MDISDLRERLIALQQQAAEELKAAKSLDKLRSARSRFLGKSGSIGQLLATIRDYPPEQRGEVGKVLNAANRAVQELANEHTRRIEQADLATDAAQTTTYDPTLPGRRPRLGSVHPVTAVQWEVESIFERLGFTVEAGPEMESDYYNFEALNIPAMHPARDMQDTFWLKNGMLLRTHTSPVQVRTMEKFGAPLRCIVPGRCFRYEAVDASHETTFHQLEGLMIDENVSIANLIGVMKLLLREVFESDVRIRLRPGYFPFVEPGFELDMSCLICGGSGCLTCRRSGWLEILPCGMVHPNVLRYGGIDPHEYTGFAFGLGLTRLAMMKYGVSDIRVMNQGDLRKLVPANRLGGPTVLAKD